MRFFLLHHGVVQARFSFLVRCFCGCDRAIALNNRNTSTSSFGNWFSTAFTFADKSIDVDLDAFSLRLINDSTYTNLPLLHLSSGAFRLTGYMLYSRLSVRTNGSVALQFYNLRTCKWQPVLDEVCFSVNVQRTLASIEVVGQTTPVQFQLSYSLVHSVMSSWALIEQVRS